MTENLNPTVNIMLSPIVTKVLDRFYSLRRPRGPRQIRRAPGERSHPEMPQKMITTKFVLDVIKQRARGDETLEQTIFRLAGGTVS
jgi:hypothetical protein